MAYFPTKKIIFLYVLILFGTGLVSAKPVLGQSQEAIKITPAFQEIVIDNNSKIATASVELNNQGTVPLTFSFQAVEVEQFDYQGNIALQNKLIQNDNPNSANFIELGTSEITLQPGSRSVIPITILNSIELSPGGHYALLLSRLKTESANNQVLPAVSVFILIRKIGGENFNMSLKENSLMIPIWNKIPSQVELTFSNQGNVHVVPHGSIQITDIFGRLVAQSIINENSFFVFPDTQRVITQKLQLSSKPIPLLPLNVRIEGKSQPGDIIFLQQGWVVYFPVWTFIGVGVTILVVVGIIILKKNND